MGEGVGHMGEMGINTLRWGGQGSAFRFHVSETIYVDR